VNDDEINLIAKENNYGWPDVQGMVDNDSEKKYVKDSTITEPLFAWSPTIAPAGIAYYDKKGPIEEWRNSLLLTTLKGRSMRVLKLKEDGRSVDSQKIFLQKVFGRMRDVVVDDEGNIFLCTTNTDWHPNSQPWMYDSLPTSRGDRIIKLKKVDEPMMKQLAMIEDKVVLKENPTSLKLETETYDFRAEDEDLANGNKLYQKYCAANGKGNIGQIPPLVDSDWVSGDKKRLIDVMLMGLNSPITVNGVEYQGEMPSYAYLEDDEIRDILNFIRTEFGDTKGNIISSDVHYQRKGLK
jgi:mono/diheme cytochrome c family protein